MSKVTLLFAAPEFYFPAPPKKIVTEADPVIDRTYFILAGRIVAVGTYA